MLPLTTAVTQVRDAALRRGHASRVPSDADRDRAPRPTPAEIDARLRAAALHGSATHDLPFFWLGALAADRRAAAPSGRAHRARRASSAAPQQRIALHVDEVLGNQEVVVKNLGRSCRACPAWPA